MGNEEKGYATSMQLWPAELEAMRPEARAVVDAGMEFVSALFGGDTPMPSDPIERAKVARQAFSATYAPVPEAQVRNFNGVECRVFVPEGKAQAVYVHFHGGGMVIGAPEMSDGANLDLAKRFNVAVVSVNYRKAPEHPFPAGPDDGIAVMQWLFDNSQNEFGADTFFLGGESAGGYMAAAVALRIRDELHAIEKVRGLVLTYGVHDWGHSPSQRGDRITNAADMLDPEGMRFYADCYLPTMSTEERRAPHVSPLFASLENLPPSFLSVGSADHLLDDTLMLAPRLAAAGNDVELFVAPEMPHGFQAFPCAITTAWQQSLDSWLTRQLRK